MLVVLFGAQVFMSLVMAVAWWVVRRTDNGGWTDVFWTFGLGVAGVAVALAPGEPVVWPWRQAMVAGLIALWSARLGGYILGRVRRGPEDVRYARLKQDWNGYGARAFGFLQIQALAGVVLCSTLRLAAVRPEAGFHLSDCAGLLILAAALVGEAVADAQLKTFKAAGGPPGRVMDRGLWGWSRHPNYVFEWLGWVAYAVIALPILPAGPAYPQGWLALAGPALMFWLLTRVSGIPPLEEAMLASRGDAYRAYQARVPAFFPRRPKTS